MNRREQDQLLNELLTGAEAADFRQASLDRSLAALRRRRQIWERSQLGALLLALGLLAATAFAPWGRASAPRRPARRPVTEQLASISGPTRITDDQLLALFPNRPVALIGRPGHQELVFLDETRQATKEASAAPPQ